MRSPFFPSLVCLCALLGLAPAVAHAGLYELSASGEITGTTLPPFEGPELATPWEFQLVYDTAAPDLDFETVGSPDPTFGRFANSSAPPALRSFHYRAGSYEVTLDDAADFATGSAVVITFTSVHAIDINIFAPGLFPPLVGGAVSFHADFNDLNSRPIFGSDGLPTDTTLGPGSFDVSTVSLLPASGGEVSGSLPRTFGIRAVPEPSLVALVLATGLLLVRYRTKGVIFSWSCAAENGFRR